MSVLIVLTAVKNSTLFAVVMVLAALLVVTGEHHVPATVVRRRVQRVRCLVSRWFEHFHELGWGYAG